MSDERSVIQKMTEACVRSKNEPFIYKSLELLMDHCSKCDIDVAEMARIAVKSDAGAGLSWILERWSPNKDAMLMLLRKAREDGAVDCAQLLAAHGGDGLSSWMKGEEVTNVRWPEAATASLSKAQKDEERATSMMAEVARLTGMSAVRKEKNHDTVIVTLLDRLLALGADPLSRDGDKSIAERIANEAARTTSVGVKIFDWAKHHGMMDAETTAGILASAWQSWYGIDDWENRWMNLPAQKKGGSSGLASALMAVKRGVRTDKEAQMFKAAFSGRKADAEEGEKLWSICMDWGEESVRDKTTSRTGTALFWDLRWSPESGLMLDLAWSATRMLRPELSKALDEARTIFQKGGGEAKSVRERAELARESSSGKARSRGRI